MPSLKSIKKRIASVKNTGQITKAMKMVSAAKLRRAQENVVAARPYAKKLSEVLGRLSGNVPADCSPLIQRREDSNKALLLVVTSDRGLCGGFNANLCKAADRFIKEHKEAYSEMKIMALGKKGNDFMKRRHGVWKSHINLLSTFNYQTAALLAQEIIDGYIEGEYDEVHVVYNEFRSVMSQEITFTKLLPVTPPASDKEAVEPREYIYEPDQAELLAELLPKHIEVQIFKTLLETVAGDHGARMTAMDSASKNAKEMIGKLTLIYNRARQAAITKELMEIISGAESVKG
jgi:F-type H+-transporting ATPase subunit gamma